MCLMLQINPAMALFWQKKVRKDEQLGDMSGCGLPLLLAETLGVKRWRQ